MRIPKVKKRRLWDPAVSKGYFESLDKWIANNKDAVEWFLENRDKVNNLLKKGPRP